MQDMRPPLSLNSIPVDVQETIAFFVATSSSSGPPKGLACLLLTSKHLSHSLSRSSLPHLYALIFRATFDYSAIVRRFPPDRYTARHLADELVRRWECLKRIRAGTSGDMLEHDLWLLWLMCLENDGKNLHHLLTYANARSFLKQYSKLYLLPQPSTPLNSHPIAFTAPPANHTSVLQSAHPVASAGRILPVDSTRNALALSIFWYLNDSSSTAMSLNKETAAEKAENQTMLRLFVFAAQKFDAFLAPWTHLYLPSPAPNPSSSSSSPSAPPDPFLADLTLRSRLITIPHLGSQPLSLSPPISAQAALLSFFARVASSLPSDDNSVAAALHPPAVGPPGLSSTSTPAATSSYEAGARSDALRHDEEEEGGWGKVKRRSRDFDVDWERAVGCLDPVRREGKEGGGQGLGVWTCRGMFEGVWGGQFAFLDFDSYRDMLSGRTRAIYEGPFGLQPQIWRLTETLVLRPSHLSPFPFPPSSSSHPHSSSSSSPPLETFHPSALNAGFPPTWTTPTATSLSPANLDAEVLTGVPGYTLVSEEEERLLREGWEEERKEGKQGGDEAELERKEKERRKRRELEERLEIIVTGTGHSAWGRFYVSGRVRCWDGMILLMKEYYPDSRGKWLYRGYVVAGGAMVGRWRDSFSELNYHGYEGSFHMTRRS
ncbi:hypothetical protein BDY24DRAFT_393396 [Mrakia frigida]|uniref:uncharacterized protein n=1 Tax=Mrakia frigida TaxID=29902 RepID=UPI003FCBF994